jgi:hypothetical protein
MINKVVNKVSYKVKIARQNNTEKVEEKTKFKKVEINT